MENNTNNNTPSTIEELAIMIQRTMASKEDIKELSGKMNTQFQGVNNHLEHLDARVGRIEADIHELRGEVVYRHEFEDVLGRAKYLERKMGIESGV